MPKGSLNVSLKGADDIFSTEESRQEQQREQVQQIPIGELFPFKNHPFKVLDDESMQRTVESVEQYGVLSPLIARPRPEGGYEIISGHRRQHAAQLAGLDTLPVIVRNMDDDAAVLLMVDSNLQRETILPSERAFAYKMKLEAIERTAGRPKNVGQVVPDYFGKRSTEVVAEGTGESYKQVQRFIRLTNLVPELLDMLRIAGDDKPAEVVRSRFMKLNADHIQFVLKCLAENSSPIRNMKQYLLASLYNAPTTMQLVYQNRTNHDFAHGSTRG